jgi:DNA-binding CsgD family transcriptional regulator
MQHEMRVTSHDEPRARFGFSAGTDRLPLCEWDVSGATAALDQLTLGIALLDSDACARYVNRIAQAIIAEGDGLSVRGGTCVAARSDDAAALRTAIDRVLTLKESASVFLARPSGKRALALLIAPVGGSRRPPAALVVITDPERGCVPPKERLIQAYGLTPAEAALVRCLLQGHDVAATADQLRITLETARTHLRRVLVKTDTHRQSDLVRLLLREVGALL